MSHDGLSGSFLDAPEKHRDSDNKVRQILVDEY